MINDKTKKLLILNKLKNVGNATLENIIKIDGYDLKDVEELVESIPKQRKVKNDKNAILEAEEKLELIRKTNLDIPEKGEVFEHIDMAKDRLELAGKSFEDEDYFNASKHATDAFHNAEVAIFSLKGILDGTLTSNGWEFRVPIVAIPEDPIGETGISKRILDTAVRDLDFDLKEETMVRVRLEKKPVYEIEGKKEVKILGIFKKKMNVKAIVDLESNEIKSLEKPWWSFLGF